MVNIDDHKLRMDLLKVICEYAKMCGGTLNSEKKDLIFDTVNKAIKMHGNVVKGSKVLCNSYLRSIVATWFAQIILERPKYEIDHQGDPPWDGSGEAKECGRFDIEQYNTLAEFLEEYTGNTTASYVSGCGLFHDTYEQELYEIISTFAIAVLKEEPNVPADRAEWAEELDARAVESEDELYVECSSWLCSELFLEGKVG